MARTGWIVPALVLLAACSDAPVTGPAAAPSALAPQECALPLPAELTLAAIAQLGARIGGLEGAGEVDRRDARALQRDLTKAERALAAGRICQGLGALRAVEAGLAALVADGSVSSAAAAPLLELLADLLGTGSAPVVTITQPVEGEIVGPSGTIQFTVAGAEVVRCALGGVQETCVPPSYDYLLDDGFWDFTVEAVDAVGQTTRATVAFYVDATAPVVTRLEAVSLGGGEARITYALTDRSPIALVGCELDGGAAVSCPLGSGGSSGEALLVGLVPGTHVIEVYGMDVFGNAGGGLPSEPPSHRARLAFEVLP